MAQLEKESVQADAATLRDIWKRILELPVRAGFPFNEPDDLESIRKLRPTAPTRRRRKQ